MSVKGTFTPCPGRLLLYGGVRSFWALLGPAPASGPTAPTSHPSFLPPSRAPLCAGGLPSQRQKSLLVKGMEMEP